MSKYDALWKHIATQGEDTLKLSFAQVGKISLKEEPVIFKKKV